MIYVFFFLGLYLIGRLVIESGVLERWLRWFRFRSEPGMATASYASLLDPGIRHAYVDYADLLDLRVEIERLQGEDDAQARR